MLGACPECNGKLSSEASSCPHCGFVQKRGPTAEGSALANNSPKPEASFSSPGKSNAVLGWLAALVGLVPAYVLIAAGASGSNLGLVFYARPIHAGLDLLAAIAPLAWLLVHLKGCRHRRSKVAGLFGAIAAIWLIATIGRLVGVTERKQNGEGPNKPIVVPGVPQDPPRPPSAIAAQQAQTKSEPPAAALPKLSKKESSALYDLAQRTRTLWLRKAVTAEPLEYRTSKTVLGDYEIRVNARIENPTIFELSTVTVAVEFLKEDGTTLGRAEEEVEFAVPAMSSRTFNFRGRMGTRYPNVRVRVVDAVSFDLTTTVADEFRALLEKHPSADYAQVEAMIHGRFSK
jgi:hypothetical protein